MAVARALVVEPEILLLDEPLSNLDANLREEMRFEIRRLHEAFGITTLYVTHDQAEAMVISDRIAVLERGRVAQVGTADELFLRPRTRFVAEFIGKTNLVEAWPRRRTRVTRRPAAAARGRRRARARRTRGGVHPAARRSRWRRQPTPTRRGRERARGAPCSAPASSATRVDYQVRLADSDVVLRVTAPTVAARPGGRGR